MEVMEHKMFDSRLKGDYDLHDIVHSPRPGMKRSTFERKSGENIKSKVLGSRLVPGLTISENSSEVFCTRFSPDGKFLAAGCGDGAIRIFNVSTGALAYNVQTGSSKSLPITALRFRPSMMQSKTRNVLVSADAEGNIRHWHITSGKCLNTIEADDQFYALDYRLDGNVFAATGKSHLVCVFF
ncbi:unnamed protein product [Choristocarpus tenellus]